MEKSLGKTVTASLPWLPSPTPTDRLRLGAPQAGQCLDNLLAPHGCACPGLPANSCLPTRHLGGPLWTGRCADRKFPPSPSPQTTVRNISPKAGLTVSGQAVCSLYPTATLQLEPWPGGHQVRHPLMGFRGSGLGQPFLALQTPATSWQSQCGAAFLGL